MQKNCARTHGSTRSIWQTEASIQLHKEKRRAEITASLLQPRRDDVVLDVGCSEGYQISYLTKYTSHIVGVDKSAHILRGKEKGEGSAFCLCKL